MGRQQHTSLWSGYLLVGLLVTMVSQLTAQNTEIWQGIALSYEVSDRLTLELSDEVRLQNGFSNFQQNYTQLQGTYKISKPIRLIGGYRFALRPIYDRHRFYLQPLWRKEFDGVKSELQIRTSIQYETDKNNDNTLHIRPLIAYQLEPKYLRIEPFIMLELFVQSYPDLASETYRIYAGLDYEISKRTQLRFSYIHQHNLLEDKTTPIIRASVFMEWDRKKKK